MKCTRCNRPRNPVLWITGIASDTRTGEPVAIEHRCVCTELNYIPWAGATRAERSQAQLAEASRQASEMAMR